MNETQGIDDSCIEYSYETLYSLSNSYLEMSSLDLTDNVLFIPKRKYIILQVSFLCVLEYSKN